MTATALLVLWVFGVPPHVGGVVLDPHDLAVSGARVTLACAGRRAEATTDARGRFEFAMPDPAEACSIDVTFPGFAKAHVTVGSRRTALVVRLEIDTATERVDVQASPRSTARPLSSTTVSLSDRDFEPVVGSTAELIAHATLLAGAVGRDTVVYVDGLPATILPPLDAIAHITVGADPFSAERSDGDVAAIEITTKPAARTLRIRSGTDAVGIGGRDMLAPAGRSNSHGMSFGVQLPVPRLPLIVSLGINTAASSQHKSTIAATATPVAAVDRTSAVTIDADYAPTTNWRIHTIDREMRSSGTNIGVGGLTLPEAGAASRTASHDLRVTVSGLTAVLESQTSLTTSATASSMRANSDAPGVSIVGGFVAGGAPIGAGSARHLVWSVKQVFRGTDDRAWSAGAEIASASDRVTQTPNPGGLMQFDSLSAYRAALDGAATGTFSVLRGGGAARYTSIHISPFVQRTVVRSSTVAVDAGLRADYEPDFGVVISPRVAATIRRDGWLFATGAGLFASHVPGFVMLHVIENEGDHLRPFVASGVSLADPTAAPAVSQDAIRSRASGLEAPREVLERVSIERQFGRLTPAVEYTAALDTHLLGSERARLVDGWVDTIESTRSAARHRLHVQLLYRGRRHQLSAHYEWTHAYDDTDGPFSSSEKPGDVAAEWTCSAGIAPHAATIADTFALKGKVSLTVAEVWRSGAPFNVTTGLDPGGSGLFNDRGGRARNSGDGPSFSSLSIYLFRRWPLPRVRGLGGGRTVIGVSVRADNVLDRTNAIDVGSVVGTPTFGKPLAALPGRSLRVLVNVN